MSVMAPGFIPIAFNDGDKISPAFLNKHTVWLVFWRGELMIDRKKSPRTFSTEREASIYLQRCEAAGMII